MKRKRNSNWQSRCDNRRNPGKVGGENAPSETIIIYHCAFFGHVLKSKLLHWPVSNHARPMADPAPMADPRWAPVAPGRPAENAGQRGLADGPPASQFAQEVRKPKLGDNDFDAR